MREVVAFYRRWISVAFHGALDRTALVAFLVLWAVDTATHYYPVLRPMKDSWMWAIPYWALLAVILFRLIAAPFVIWKGDQKRLRSFEDEDQRIARLQHSRLLVSRLLRRAEQLKTQCASDRPMDENAINSWLDDCEGQLRAELGEEAIHSLASDANTPNVELSRANTPERNVRLWVYLNRRASRLDQILNSIPVA